MVGPLSRRSLLAAVPGILAVTPRVLAKGERVGPPAPIGGADDVVHPGFPSQDPAHVRQMVTVAHFSIDEVRGLLSEQPELAKATWDWGFGDWETALGAASHTGNRDIALLLIEHGARIDIFAAAMLGQTDVVRALIEASPGIQQTPGPHGLTLLHHARAGGKPARDTVAYLESIKGADEAPASAPLDAGERERYVGVYTFAPGERGDLTIEYSEKYGALTIARAGGTPRNLIRNADETFSPIGAPSVRITFTVPRGDNGVGIATGLSINAPLPLVSAERSC